MDSQFNGPKTYHSHIKYHMTLNIIFSVPNHHQHEHLPVECGVPEGAGSNVSKHHSRLRGESSKKTIIFLYPTLKNVQQRLSTNAFELEVMNALQTIASYKQFVSPQMPILSLFS
jgi:hypothetical protein